MTDMSPETSVEPGAIQQTPHYVVANFPFTPHDQERLRATLGDMIAFTLGDQPFREALLNHPETDVVIMLLPPANLPALAPNLRWLALTSAGSEQVFRVGLPRSMPNLPITTASGIHAVPISEYVLSVMLRWARQWPRMLALQRAHEWPQQGEILGGELEGATLGIIGLGAIGRRIAQLGHAFGMRVVAQRRSASPGQTDPDADELLPPERLADLLAQADFVVISAPNTSETRHVINAERLGQMKRSAVLINIARGDLVDEEALIAALRTGTIAGAGFDVTAREPLPPDSPLWDMPNVILSPHISGLTLRYSDRLTTLLLENIARYRAGQPLINLVDITRGY